MASIIRKISVGAGYPDGAIHYQVGGNVNLKNRPYTVVNITRNMELLNYGKTAFDIIITNGVDTVLWKTIIDVPVVVENNIDFE